ncbi:MAG: nucleotide exchange factor GrpE [Pseudomonadota bacterium]|jgi:molecular chaperone GrpE
MSGENKVEAGVETEAKKEAEAAAGAESVIDPTEQLQKDVEKWKNDYLYLRAEFETYKRNAIKERADITKYGSERLVNEILAVVDNFDRALNIKATPENIDVYSQGVKMSAAELKSVLTRFGVTEVKCEGIPFDPTLHEALGAEETDGVAEGHISKVFRSAYKLHDRLIRPAQVIVAKAKPKSN